MIVLTILATCFFSLTAEACTLWAANGDVVEGGGSLIVKNRDWAPDHTQTLKLVTPQNGYKYIGLYAIKGQHNGLKAGINERGLVAVSASAGSIPSKERREMPYTHALYEQLLRQCGTVEEAIEQSNLFLGPQFIMLADKNEVATIEIGPDGVYSISVKKNEAIYHTNHYINDSMSEFNRFIGPSSSTRYNRISELLNNTSPYTLDKFISFSNDRNDGPDNSILRTGSTSKKQRTLATWAVSIPKDSAPELYVKLLNPGEDEKIIRINVDDAFLGKLNINDI